MRFTAQQISEIVAFLDRYPNFDSEEEELPEVLVFSQYAEEKHERQDVVFQAKRLMNDLVNELPYVRADLDTSTDWIYIYITHN
jgi:hypothetical protein